MKSKKLLIPAAFVAIVLLAGSVFAIKYLPRNAATEPTVQEQVSVTNAQARNSASEAAIQKTESNITEAEAKGIALKHAGLNESDVQFVRVHLDWDDGHQEYEVEFYSGNTEYDYDIDAKTGEILSHDRDAEFYTPQTVAAKTTTLKAASASGEVIGETKAKSIALSHAGLTENKVKFVRVHLDLDDGRQEYEVEFYSGNTEYDYYIDAKTGEILSYDRDAEYYAANPNTTAVATGKQISADTAKKTALSHAGFKENEVSRLIVEYDLDDGRAEYDVEFNVGRIEYSYEIDAISGKILSYEAEKDD